MSQINEGPPQKKRLRVPISCDTCRKKKIKCDKGRPSCKSCLKSKSVCQYQEMKFNGSQHQLNNILNLGSFVPKQNDNYVNKSAKHEVPSTYTFEVNDEQGPISSPTVKSKAQSKVKKDDSVKEDLSLLGNKMQFIESNLHGRINTFVSERSADNSQFYSEDDTMNFYDGYSPLQINESRVFNHGPLSWVTLVKKDIFVRCLWIKVLSTNRSSLILHSTVKNVEDDVRDADDEPPNEIDAENKEKQYNRKSIGHTTTYRPDTEFGTIQLILRILPEKKYIWILIDRFFEVVYPFMPYLDHGNFMRQIVKVIGERSTEVVKVVQLGIDKRLDFAFVGILLLILRFACLSLQSNCDSSQKASLEMSGILDYNISVDFPTAAQYCLNQFRILRSSNLEILQCSLYMRIYQRYSPEDGDGADADSQIYNGMLFQMAISIGLNRDPEELLKPSVNPKLCQLRRKIWFAILQLETYHSLVLGSPSYTRIQSSNVKLPDSNLSEFNSPTQETEHFVNYWITKYNDMSTTLGRINELVLNLKGDTKVSDVISCLKEIEKSTYGQYESFPQLLKLPVNTLSASLYKVKSIQRYLEFMSTILCVYFHLFINYDTLQDKRNSLYYLKRIIQISSELICGFTKTVNKLHKYVGNGFDFYLTHTLLISMHRAIQGQFSFFCRLSHLALILELQGDPTNIIPSIKELQNSVTTKIANYLKELKKLTPKYYYAWKMFKAQNLIYQIMTSDQIFKLKANMVVPNQTKMIIGDIPQFSILSSLSIEALQSLYAVDSYMDETEATYNQTAYPANTPTALSHILNATPSTSSPSVSLSPDRVHQDLMSTSTSKEVDDLWLSLLNRKKENDIDESITYSNQSFRGNDATQLAQDPDLIRQLQQPDFASLLEMNSVFSRPANQVPQNASMGQLNTMSANTIPSQYSITPDNKNAPPPPPPPPLNPQYSNQQQQQQQELLAQRLQYDQINLNGLLDGQLTLNQLFGTPESPFNNFL